ncbi:3'5'-cyclic nucleotide phosphodiesterase, partial [Kipferlia bialata]
FNDRSVLENHHAKLGLGLIENSGLIMHFSDVEKRMFSLLFVDLVIETDPSKNYEFTRRNLNLCRDVTRQEWHRYSGALPVYKKDPAEKEVAATRFSLLALIIKLADLSNPFRPNEVSRLFAECVMREFFRQGEQEKLYNHSLELPAHMDRYMYPANMYTCQISFIRGLVLPLLKLYADVVQALGDCLPGDGVPLLTIERERSRCLRVSHDSLIHDIYRNLNLNLSGWEDSRQDFQDYERGRKRYEKKKRH